MAITTNSSLDTVELKRIICDIARYDVNYSIPQEMLERAELRFCYDYLADALVYQLSVFMAKAEQSKTEENYEVTTTYSVPLTWWDHVKQEFAPTWFLKKYPVKLFTFQTGTHHKVTTTTTHICPHVSIPNDNRRHIEFLSFEQPSTAWNPNRPA